MKISCEAKPNSGFSYLRKAEVSIGILTIIEIVIAAILIGWAVWFFGNLAGMWSQDEDVSSLAAFDSLVAKINQVIQDPSPLAYTTMPYFLGDDNVLVGHTDGTILYKLCIEEIPEAHSRSGASTAQLERLSAERYELGYPDPAVRPQCREGGNCLCLKQKRDLRDNIKCASMQGYDEIYFIGGEEGLRQFYENEKGAPVRGIPIHPPHIYSSYTALKYLVLRGFCSSHAFGQQPLYIEKHEFPTGKKIISILYGGNQETINQRVVAVVQEAFNDHIRLSDEASDLQEKIRLMLRLLKYPLNGDQQLIVSGKLCDYATLAKQWRLSADYCSGILAQFTYEFDPSMYEQVYANYVTALINTNAIARLTEQFVVDGMKVFTNTNSNEYKRVVSYALASYNLLRAFDVSILPSDQLLYARRSRHYYDFYLQNPDEKYFVANRNMIELVNKLEGSQKAGEFADSKITEYRNVLETLRVGGGYPPEIEPRYRILDASYGQELTQQKIERIIADVTRENQHFNQSHDQIPSSSGNVFVSY